AVTRSSPATSASRSSSATCSTATTASRRSAPSARDFGPRAPPSSGDARGSELQLWRPTQLMPAGDVLPRRRTAAARRPARRTLTIRVAAVALILWNEYIALSLLSNRPLRFSGAEHRERRPEDGQKR